MYNINPLNAKLKPICQLLALLGALHILHVSRVRVTSAYAIYRILEVKGTLWMEFWCEVFLEIWRRLCVLYFCTEYVFVLYDLFS
jgi:hypothetical protein